jgi:nucleoside-diphosphate-sugar epimerase
MKHVAVLGSAGQIGAPLVEYLSDKGYLVSTFDIASNPQEDLRYRGAAEKAIIGADMVFFLAFDVGGSRYLSKYQHTHDFMRNNMLLMANTFNSLKYNRKKFIFASSQMASMSYSPYGLLKNIGERETEALDGRVVKFWNVYGPEHDMEKSHVITDFILKAKSTSVIDMMTTGEEEREFLYVEDACKALETVMLNYDRFTPTSPLHITSFESTKVSRVADIIADHYGAYVVPGDKRDLVQMDARNKPDRFILNYWQPETTIEKGIANIIKEMDNA